MTTFDDLFAGVDTAPAPQPLPTYGPADDLIAASAALSPAGEVHVPGMLRPFLPHQAAAYEYMLDALARWGGCIVGDGMGLGKTQVLLAGVAHVLSQRGGYALMIAPPVTLAGYMSDAAAAFPGLTMVVLKGRTAPRDDQGNVILPPADIYWISDDALTLRAWLTNGLDTRNKFVLSNVVTGAAILSRDEIHRDKGAQGKPATPTARARLMLSVGEALRRQGTPIIAATGTLTTNRPIEALIPLQIVGGLDLVKAVAPGATSAIGFAFAYCKPVNNGYGYNYAGCDFDKLPTLHKLLRSTCYVRREIADIGNLPRGRWLVKPLALNGVLDKYKRLSKDFLAEVRDSEGPESMWRKAKMEAAQKLFSLWREAGKAKAAATVEYVADLVDQDRPVILFYFHNDSFQALATGLSKRKIKVGVINGQVSGQARIDAINDFQAGRTMVMLAQVQAAGIGVTLTRAADAVFNQCPWSAGDLAQAAGRNLRTDDISRARALAGGEVMWHVLQAAHEDGSATIDMHLWDVLEMKARACDAINSGREVTMSDDDIQHAVLTAWYNSQA